MIYVKTYYNAGYTTTPVVPQYSRLRPDYQNLEERKKATAGYQAYDDEAELEAAALGLHRPVLAKYDDEIDQHKKDKSRGFVIGDADAVEAKRFRDMMVLLSGLRLPTPLSLKLTATDRTDVAAAGAPAGRRQQAAGEPAHARPADRAGVSQRARN